MSQTKAKYTFDQLSIRVQEVALHKAKEDLARATLQYEGKLLTREAFEHSRKTYESAQAQPEASKDQVNVSKSMIASAHSTIRTADALSYQAGTLTNLDLLDSESLETESRLNLLRTRTEYMINSAWLQISIGKAGY